MTEGKTFAAKIFIPYTETRKVNILPYALAKGSF